MKTLYTFLKYISIVSIIGVGLAANTVSAQSNDLDYAYSQLRNGDTISAITIFERHVLANPYDSQIQMQLAYLYQNKGYNDLAVRYFQNVVDMSSDASMVQNAKTSINYLRSPANNSSDLDEAYRKLNLGDAASAIILFESYLRTNPTAYNVNLQLGYLYNSSGDNTMALRHFRAVELGSSDIQQLTDAKRSILVIEKQMSTPIGTTITTSGILERAYSKLNTGDRIGAALLFEEHLRTNPNDTRTALQLAYVYADMKDNTKARKYFTMVRDRSTSTDEVETSITSLNNLSSGKFKTSRSSVDIYFYNNWDTFQENYVSNFLGRYNFLLAKSFYTGVYTDIYLDSRSKPGNIFNDRFAEFGAFVRFAPVNWMSFEIRGGYVRLIDKKENKFNFKPILTLANRFNNPPIQKTKTSRNQSFYFDAYAAALYDHKYENFFGQTTLREVLRYLLGGFSYLDFYLKQQAAFDSEQFDFNNYGEFGGGIAFAPDIKHFPELFAEASNKVYFIGERESTFQVKIGFLLTFYSPL